MQFGIMSVSDPTTPLARIAAATERIQLSTSRTLITTNDPVKIAEDYAMLHYMSDGRIDLTMGHGNTGPSTPGSARTFERESHLSLRTMHCCANCGRMRMSRGRTSSALPFADPPPHRTLSTPSPHSCGTAPSAPPKSPNRPPIAATVSSTTISSGRPSTPPEWSPFTASDSNTTATGRRRRQSQDWTGELFMRRNSQDAIRHSDALLAGGQDRNDVA